MIKLTSRKKKKKVVIFNMVAAVLWTLWKERNNRTFEDVNIHSTNIWKDVCPHTGCWAHKNGLFKDYGPRTIAINLNAFCNT